MHEQEEPTKISVDEANDLVIAHKGWAESIAKSVARAWNLDWQLDGLDGAALEALLFCARRFQPDRGVPFKGYARKRIHEAATEAARRSKGWRRGAGTASRTERLAREVSAELFNVFPELRAGQLPSFDGDDGGSQGTRIALQQMLIGASIIATRQGLADALPDDMLDFKRMLQTVATLEIIHQLLIWKVYWEGNSLRTVATAWETDELNVIREHKVLLEYLQKAIGKAKSLKIPRVRPGLKQASIKLKKEHPTGMFRKLLEEG
ncbi:MAG: hypothetical protein KDD42_09165 [Bdellovibrionales bacterium]|nr:hypothetical protein [Bdellovibrionales bacterium]